MPRTCPSMRFKRLPSAALSWRTTRACAAVRVGAGSTRDFIASVLDCAFDIRQARAPRIVSDPRRSRLQRYRDLADAGKNAQHARDAGHAAPAGHAIDFQRNGFHAALLDCHHRGAFQRLSNSALPTTDTELAAIAAPAIAGWSRPKAASGMPSTLYTKAKNRFCRIFATVARESRIASTTALRSGRISVISAASMAISDPAPMAKLTSDTASAGASLIPSPTMPVT